MIYFKDDIKDVFLEQFNNEQTKKVYSRIFKKSKNLEEKYNLDVLNFDENMLKELIDNYIKPQTKQSARTYCNILSSYIQWGIEHGHSILKDNPLSKGQEYFYTFVKEQEKLYMSKNEVDSIVFGLLNAQDSFIIQALFDGIQGKKVSELTLLTRGHIEEAQKTGLLKLVDIDGKERVIKPDAKTIILADIAVDEPEYYKKNGQFDYVENLKDVVALPQSDYVLKPTVTSGNVNNKPVSHYTVYNRLEMIKALPEFEEWKEALSTKNIVRSGMIYEAKKILDNNEKLDRKAIESICQKFGVSYKWSLRDFLNEETVNEVYAK